MEFSKITVCRQDIVVLSDTEPNEEANMKKKKKSKSKIECVRKVQISSVKTNRIVPLCCRQRCRNAQHYHRVTSKNTKYTNTRKARGTSRKRKRHCKRHTHQEKAVPKVLYSPITVESSSDTYEDISECSFHTISSESDEIEELIKTTRKRMKKENIQFNHRLVNSAYSTVTLDDNYDKISSDEETYNSSLHSMDTIVIEHLVPIPSPPITPKHSDDDIIETSNDIEPIKLASVQLIPSYANN